MSIDVFVDTIYCSIRNHIIYVLLGINERDNGHQLFIGYKEGFAQVALMSHIFLIITL